MTELKTASKEIRKIPPVDFDIIYDQDLKEVRSDERNYLLKYGGGRIGWSQYSFKWEDKTLIFSVEWEPKKNVGRDIYLNHVKFFNSKKSFSDIHELSKIIDIVCVFLAYHYDKGISNDATVHLLLNSHNISNLLSGYDSSESLRGIYE